MKNSSSVVKVFGCLTLFLVQVGATPTAHAFGRARAPASAPSPAPTSTPSPVSTPRPTNTPKPSPAPTATPTPISSTCVSKDPNKLCMGVKMVSYTKGGTPVLTESQANTLLAGVNKAWAPCNISFQLEKYEMIDPATRGLEFDNHWQSDGDVVRNNFEDGNKFLVVSVGKLTGGTIAVTQMPGAGIYGVLVEDDYANNPLTVGHELGHYMGLYHVNSTENLMSAYIGPNTAAVTTAQCTTARNTNYQYWQSMMRN